MIYPFAVWLLVGFLRDFPVEIEEAAMIDGRSRLRAPVQVVVPIIAPGMAVAALFAFITTWNEFLFAIVLTGIEPTTMRVRVTAFTTGGTDIRARLHAPAVSGEGSGPGRRQGLR